MEEAGVRKPIRGDWAGKQSLWGVHLPLGESVMSTMALNCIQEG